MTWESRLPWIIFAVLVALIVVPLGLWQLGESRRPVLEQVRIVTASAGDPVFRTGPRRVERADGLRIAAAIAIRDAGGESTWMAPVDELVIDGLPVEHQRGSAWPEDDRVLRVFWFTVEAAYLGGDLEADNAEKQLTQRSFLAPEMGRGLLAAALPEQHNDDQINLGDENAPVAGGTIRLYAKVEVAEKADSIASEQSAATPGAAAAFDEDFAAIHIGEPFPEPVAPVVGELFRLPGFEPSAPPDESWDDVTVAATGLSFRDLVERRFVASSWTFAATALTGGTDLDPAALSRLGTVSTGEGEPSRDGRPLRWGDDVRPGDLLEDRSQFVVLLGDDGDGVLGRSDPVMVCWRRPAAVTTLDQAIRDDAVTAELRRYEP
ncbi:MAG: hypothetical protein V2I67_18520 [Thermoanaerobaculales bacterium]|jgi:hypothetical protein|nr:hypothetical protein [Thermoanaerobaculales bacterium]